MLDGVSVTLGRTCSNGIDITRRRALFWSCFAEAMVSYFHTPHNQKILEQLLQYVQFEKKEESKTEQILEGKTFVVTGSLDHFDNRKQLKEEIEQMGGKVTGSVSKKTDYLINNDKMSQSSKNKKAMELNIPILSEEDFLDLIGR